MSWTDESIVAPSNQQVVQDDYLPAGTDLATDWQFDVRTNALADNDNPVIQNTGPGSGSPLRGSGLVQREFARLVQIDASNLLLAQNPSLATVPGFPHVVGDPACRTDPVSAQALGCTGFEGFAIGGVPEATDPDSACTNPTGPGGSFGDICDNIVVAGGHATALGYGAYYTTALAPGDPSSYICDDPSQAGSLTGHCVDGPLWTNALQAVIRVAGNGNVRVLPWELQDRRYYFRWWAIALVKYFKAYGKYPAPFGSAIGPAPTKGGFVTADAVANMPLDLTSLFFDVSFAAEFDKAEYIERSFMSTTDIVGTTALGQPVTVPAKNMAGGWGPAAVPMDYSYGSDTIGGNQRYSDWYRRMDREEEAMFQAMLVDKNNLPGSENGVNITNLGGSPILAGDYLSYECATTWDPAQGPNTIVTIHNHDGSVLVSDTWINVCSLCPNLLLLPASCPFPPGVGPFGAGTADMDQNALLGGDNKNAKTRLSAYPAVWGGTGGTCPNSNGDSYQASNSPYLGSCAGGGLGSISVAANTHGSIFKVGLSDPTGARIGFLDSSGNPQKPGQVPAGNAQLLAAYVNLPNMANPYNNFVGTTPGASMPLTGKDTIHATVPWTPNVEGIGFSIPLTGQRSKFVQTAQLDFTGVLETYLIDYEPWIDPTTNAPDGTIKVDAIEGDDFLGEVFLCQDNGTSGGTAGDFIGTQDLLGVHMYDSGGNVLTWLTNHPGAQDTCNIVVQYSQYNNFLDYIASLTGGVVVGISQGSGYGRIDSVVVFDPILGQIP